MAKTGLASSADHISESKAVLESALRARKLDRTLNSAAPLAVPQHGDGHAFSVAPLDACLHGGLPQGQLCEIAGPQSSGRTTLLLHLIATATSRGGIAAL